MERENSSEILAVLQAVKSQAQEQARRDRMSQPNMSSVRDASARRRDSMSTTLTMGSIQRCDVSSAIVATNVVRVP